MRRFTLAIATVMLLTGCLRSTDQITDPIDDAVQLSQIDQFYNKGEYETAAREAQAYVQQHPKSNQAWSILGWSYLKTDQLDLAKAAFDKALALNPWWDNAYVGLGVMYRQQCDNVKARDAYLKAVEILPDNAEAFSSLLVLELMEGNDQQAVEYGERAWALRKDYPSIPANLAIAYHYLGDHGKRDEFLQHAEQLGYRNMQQLHDIVEGKASIR